jgi:hypothetical protein
MCRDRHSKDSSFSEEKEAKRFLSSRSFTRIGMPARHVTLHQE